MQYNTIYITQCNGKMADIFIHYVLGIHCNNNVKYVLYAYYNLMIIVHCCIIAFPTPGGDTTQTGGFVPWKATIIQIYSKSARVLESFVSSVHSRKLSCSITKCINGRKWCLTLHSEVYRAVLSPHIQPNASKHTGWSFTVQMDNDPEHTRRATQEVESSTMVKSITRPEPSGAAFHFPEAKLNTKHTKKKQEVKTVAVKTWQNLTREERKPASGDV